MWCRIFCSNFVQLDLELKTLFFEYWVVWATLRIRNAFCYLYVNYSRSWSTIQFMLKFNGFYIWFVKDIFLMLFKIKLYWRSLNSDLHKYSKIIVCCEHKTIRIKVNLSFLTTYRRFFVTIPSTLRDRPVLTVSGRWVDEILERDGHEKW